MGFLPFFTQSAEPDWIPPTFEISDNWCYVNICAATIDEACQLQASSLEVPPLYLRTVAGIIPVDEVTQICRVQQTAHWADGTTTDQGIAQFYFSNSPQNIPQCNDPDYQMGVDSDNLDGIDQCHRTSCPDMGTFWSSQSGVSTPTGRICVQGINGASNCEYEAVENDDGSKSDYTFSPVSGQGCSCGNEAVPCVNLADGEVGNNPAADGCVQLGETVACEANPEEKCQNGICEAGCGYVQDKFMCVEATDPNGGLACTAGDQRPECQGKAEGDCPAGVLNCIDQPTTPDEPPAPCVDGDTRPECAGKAAGEVPEAGEGGATTDDINALGAKIDQTNKNLKDIKDDTKKIADRLNDEHAPPDLDPDNNIDWGDTKTAINQFTSEGDVNASEAQFTSDFAAQEGFFNNQILGVVPTGGTCSNLSFQFGSHSGVVDACQYLIHAKIVIEWAMILAFLIYVKTTIGRLRPNQ